MDFAFSARGMFPRPCPLDQRLSNPEAGQRSSEDVYDEGTGRSPLRCPGEEPRPRRARKTGNLRGRRYRRSLMGPRAAECLGLAHTDETVCSEFATHGGLLEQSRKSLTPCWQDPGTHLGQISPNRRQRAGRLQPGVPAIRAAFPARLASRPKALKGTGFLTSVTKPRGDATTSDASDIHPLRCVLHASKAQLLALNQF